MSSIATKKVQKKLFNECRRSRRHTCWRRDRRPGNSGPSHHQQSKHAPIVFFDIDGEETKTALRLDEYGGEDEGSWVLLEAIEVAEAAGDDVVDEAAHPGFDAADEAADEE